MKLASLLFWVIIKIKKNKKIKKIEFLCLLKRRYGWTDLWIYGPINGPTDWPMDGPTDRPTDRQTLL